MTTEDRRMEEWRGETIYDPPTERDDEELIEGEEEEEELEELETDED